MLTLFWTRTLYLVSLALVLEGGGVLLSYLLVRSGVDPPPVLRSPVVGDGPLALHSIRPVPSTSPSQPGSGAVLVLHVDGDPSPAVGPLVVPASSLVPSPVILQIGEVKVVLRVQHSRVQTEKSSSKKPQNQMQRTL